MIVVGSFQTFIISPIVIEPVCICINYGLHLNIQFLENLFMSAQSKP